MAIAAQDIYSIAEQLSKSSDEIKIRTSISRSYYCSYHLALHSLGETDLNEWKGGDGGVHSKLISVFTKSSDMKKRAIGHILNELKRKRVIADYYLSNDQSKEDAESSLILVDSLMKKL